MFSDEQFSYTQRRTSSHLKKTFLLNLCKKYSKAFDDIFLAVRHKKVNEAKKVNRFLVLRLIYHVNLCRKNKCGDCKLIMEYRDYFLRNFSKKTSHELISFFQQHCRLNHSTFYSLFLLLKSIAAIDKEMLNLNNKLKETLSKWKANTKI